MVLPEVYRNSILYFGTEGTRFIAALEMMHRLDPKLPVRMIKVNADPDRQHRLQSLVAVRKFKLNWRVILMTGVPPEDVEILKNHSIGIIYPDEYTIYFYRPLPDGSEETVYNLTDVDKIEAKLREILYGKQDIQVC
jgi:hypothetical protein